MRLQKLPGESLAKRVFNECYNDEIVPTPAGEIQEETVPSFDSPLLSPEGQNSQ